MLSVRIFVMRRLYVVQSQPRFEAEKDAPEDTNLGHHLATMLSRLPWTQGKISSVCYWNRLGWSALVASPGLLFGLC